MASLPQCPGPTFIACIDEAGDEGFRFGAGSTEWFVLSAVIVRASDVPATITRFDQLKARVFKGAPRAFHFRELPHMRRVELVGEIASSPLVTMSLLVWKPGIVAPERFRTGRQLYWYACRLLIERVSWCCRDSRLTGDQGDGGAKLILSNRSSMDYGELRAYLDSLRPDPGVRIDWSAIRSDRVVPLPANLHVGLQLADAVAGSWLAALERRPSGYVEPRYARMLMPVTYSRRGTFSGYGVKLWPSAPPRGPGTRADTSDVLSQLHAALGKCATRRSESAPPWAPVPGLPDGQ